MLKYKSHIKKISSVFFRYRNEIDIYTEDNILDKEFYVTLLNRLLSDTIKIRDINPLGSKSDVINICKNDKDNIRKKVYIVDGDLDLITDTNEKHIKYLYVLDVYCIENYLIEENGIVHLLYLYMADKDKSKIQSILDFKKFISTFTIDFVQLFLHFALLKRIGGGPTIKNIYYFLNIRNSNFIIDSSKLKSYLEAQKASIINIYKQEGSKDPEKEYKANINSLQKKWKSCNSTSLCVISGKDYLLPLVQLKIKEINRSMSFLSTKSLKIQLADSINLNRMNSLRKYIFSI